MENGLYGFPPGLGEGAIVVDRLPPASAATVGKLYLVTANPSPGSNDYANMIMNTQGLKTYYQMREASGTVMVDSTGNRNGAYSGAVTLQNTSGVTDLADFSAKFGNINSNVGAGTVTNASADILGTSVTLEAWYHVNNINQGWIAGFSALGFGFTTAGLLGFKNSSGVVTAPAPPFTVLGVSNGTFGYTGTWHHLAIVSDISQNILKGYADGQLVIRVPGASQVFGNSTLSLGIGSLTGNGLTTQVTYDTLIDEVALYGAALSQDTIKNHFLLGSTSRREAVLCMGSVNQDGTYQFLQLASV